jgi:hypothetical protein
MVAPSKKVRARKDYDDQTCSSYLNFAHFIRSLTCLPKFPSNTTNLWFYFVFLVAFEYPKCAEIHLRIGEILIFVIHPRSITKSLHMSTFLLNPVIVQIATNRRFFQEFG